MTLHEKERLRYLEDIVDIQDEYISGKIDELEYNKKRIELLQNHINFQEKEAEYIKNLILQQGANKEIVDELVKLSKNPFKGV